MQSQNRQDPNYLMQINAFNVYLDSNYLPQNAQLLWFRLIHLFNKCGWKEWVQIDTFRLMSMLGVQSQNAVFRARDALINAGLLSYNKGRKGHPNRYRMHYFLYEKSIENASVCVCTSECRSEQNTNDIDKPNQTKPNKTRIDTRLSAKADAKARPRADYEKVMDAFNRICVCLPQVQTLNDKRKQAIRAAYDSVQRFGGWDKLFETVQQSDFLTGRNGSWNGCGFDWILKPQNLVKIMEGNYDDKPNKPARRNDAIYYGTFI